jgi:hypothetical protein
MPIPSSSPVFLRLERQMRGIARLIRDLPDPAPGLLVVRYNEFVHTFRDDVSLRPIRLSEYHEGLFRLCGWSRIDHRLRRTILVVDLDKVPSPMLSSAMSWGFI